MEIYQSNYTGAQIDELLEQVEHSSNITQLSDLSDVNISEVEDGQALVYNEESSKWENKAIGGGGSSLKYITIDLVQSTAAGQGYYNFTLPSGIGILSNLSNILSVTAYKDGHKGALATNIYLYNSGTSGSNQYWAQVAINSGGPTSSIIPDKMNIIYYE